MIEETMMHATIDRNATPAITGERPRFCCTLQVVGQKQEHGEDRDRRQHDRKVGAAAVTVKHDAQRQQRVRLPCLDEREADQQQDPCRDHAEREAVGPARGARVREAVDQSEQAGGGEQRSGDVDARALLRRDVVQQRQRTCDPQAGKDQVHVQARDATAEQQQRAESTGSPGAAPAERSCRGAALQQRQRGLPSHDPCDPGYRRLRYVRYADDILLGFTGPKAEAEEIKRQLAQFPQEDLKLELSETKTLITHASNSAARFLGYEITAQHDNRKQTAGRRSVNGQIRLRVPADVIKAKCSQYMKRGQPADRSALMNEEDHAIINRYGAEYRGIVQYYLLAGDVYRLDRLHWVTRTSLLRTLAGKYGSTVTKMAHKYRATIETPQGPHKCLQVSVERSKGRTPLVATFGGIPLRRQKHAVLKDLEPVPATGPRKELINGLLKGRCELCGQPDEVQVHQIRKLADLGQPGTPEQPEWARIMAERRRKTLVVCTRCHADIHHRRPTASTTE
jgi:hypothetical protein